jgi:hypothetical protein
MLQEVSSPTTLCPTSSKVAEIVGSIAMDIEQLQNIEVGLHKQAEAMQSTNELISKS